MEIDASVKSVGERKMFVWVSLLVLVITNPWVSCWWLQTRVYYVETRNCIIVALFLDTNFTKMIMSCPRFRRVPPINSERLCFPFLSSISWHFCLCSLFSWCCIIFSALGCVWGIRWFKLKVLCVSLSWSGEKYVKLKWARSRAVPPSAREKSSCYGVVIHLICPVCTCHYLRVGWWRPPRV